MCDQTRAEVTCNKYCECELMLLPLILRKDINALNKKWNGENEKKCENVSYMIWLNAK